MTLESRSISKVFLEVPEAFHVAFALHRGGLLAEAEMLYRRLLVASPTHVDALHFLGVLCHQNGRNGEAELLIRRILEVQPENADAYNNLGNVLQEQGNREGAEEAYRKAIALRPDHGAAHNNLAVILAVQNQLPEAIATARRAVELAPEASDHRYNLANALRRAGHLDEAIAVYRQTLDMEPRHERARQSLGRMLELEGRRSEAADVFRDWLKVEPGNPTASHLYAALSEQDIPDRASDGYVRSLFDELSDSFDSHLSRLAYQAPALVGEAVAREIPDAQGNLDVLDAGCGTGLCGPFLRSHAKKLIGVDLSGGMLRKAAELRVYDELVQAELTAYLSQARESSDLIACADTLCYFGELEGVFQATAGALRPGGLFAFTLEDGTGEEPAAGFRLHTHGRYSHDRNYAVRKLESVGFEVKRADRVSLRSEAGEPVAGLVVTARKPD